MDCVLVWVNGWMNEWEMYLCYYTYSKYYIAVILQNQKHNEEKNACNIKKTNKKNCMVKTTKKYCMVLSEANKK